MATIAAGDLLCLNDEAAFPSGDELRLLSCYRRADERGRQRIMQLAEAEHARADLRQVVPIRAGHRTQQGD